MIPKKKIGTFIKKWGLRSLYLFVILLAAIWFNNYHVNTSTKKKLFNTIEEIPSQKVGLLLGTIKELTNGQINLYFTYRISAAVDLYKAGKIEHIIVSGDNGSKGYNEPEDMQQALIANGVPAERITLDYAGFRTLDSVVRADKIFSQQKFTVISQPFHTARAVYIARRKGLDAIGFNARDVSLAYGKTVLLREYLARVKMQLDLLFGKQPKFLGPKVDIN